MAGVWGEGGAGVQGAGGAGMWSQSRCAGSVRKMTLAKDMHSARQQWCKRILRSRPSAAEMASTWLKT